MSERTPIEPAEIRKGDTIRFEAINGMNGLVAREYVAGYNGDSRPGMDTGELYLLHRPDPLAGLPRDSTVGIVTFEDGSSRSGEVLVDAGNDLWISGVRYGSENYFEFIPGEIVPTAAIDALVLAHPWRPGLMEPVDYFLRVVRSDR